MTDETTRDLPGADTYETDRRDRAMDRPDDPEAGATGSPEEGDTPWLKEGTDAPDAADIESPDEQR